MTSLRLGAIAGLALLSACGSDGDDLDSYIAEVKSRKSTAVEPIPQVLVYEPHRYTQAEARDPFLPFAQGLTDATAAVSTSTLAPDPNRNREPLEAFPLEALRLKGRLGFQGQEFAVIEAPDNKVHRVQVGNYMGQNYGRISAITAAEVQLEEIVPDGLGGYTKRTASVSLTGEEE
nr:pilus assembly protein PilP [Oceanococcus sp. HetDA_MAG_MS8]